MADLSFAKGLRYRLEACAAYILYGFFRLLPVDVASKVGGILARWLGPWSGIHRKAKKNLDLSLPDLTPEDRQTILRDVWDNFGRVIAEYGTLSRIGRAGAADRIELHGIEYLKHLAHEEKPAIIFSGHFANWEMLVIAISQNVKPPLIIYRAPNNPFIEGLLKAARRPVAATMVPKGRKGARDMIRALEDNAFIAMLVDQKINTGLPVPFFGRDAMTGDAVVRLALRSNCPLIPARMERMEDCHFKITFEEPWKIESSDDVDADVSATLVRMNQKLESWIRDRPGQWLWLHNRWPKDGSVS